MGQLIGMIIAGAIIGALARLFMKGQQNISILWTINLGRCWRVCRRLGSWSAWRC